MPDMEGRLALQMRASNRIRVEVQLPAATEENT